MSTAPVFRPTNYALWASGVSGYVTEPIAADKAQGFLPTGIARSSYVNWLWGVNGQWNQYLDQQDRGRIFREDWMGFGGVTASVGRIPENARWSAGVTGVGNLGLGLVIPFDMLPQPALSLNIGAAAVGSRTTLASTVPLGTSGLSGTIQALTADVCFRGPSGAATFVIGVAALNGTDCFTGPSGFGTTGHAWFRKAAGITAWLCDVSPTGASAISVNSGVVPKLTGEGPQQLRMELCAPNSPFGSVVRFLIDGALVATGVGFSKASNVAAGIRVDATGFPGALIGTLDWSVYR